MHFIFSTLLMKNMAQGIRYLILILKPARELATTGNLLLTTPIATGNSECSARHQW
jgi:hypothetical protein